MDTSYFSPTITFVNDATELSKRRNLLMLRSNPSASNNLFLNKIEPIPENKSDQVTIYTWILGDIRSLLKSIQLPSPNKKRSWLRSLFVSHDLEDLNPSSAPLLTFVLVNQYIDPRRKGLPLCDAALLLDNSIRYTGDFKLQPIAANVYFSSEQEAKAHITHFLPGRRFSILHFAIEQKNYELAKQNLTLLKMPEAGTAFINGSTNFNLEGRLAKGNEEVCYEINYHGLGDDDGEIEYKLKNIVSASHQSEINTIQKLS